MNNIKRMFVILLLSVCVGCASGRNPEPVPIQTIQDFSMTCEQLQSQYYINTVTATCKINKNNQADVKDFVLGVLIWPGLADFKNADGVEGNALLDRNLYLKELARTNMCDLTGYVIQPKRYR